MRHNNLQQKNITWFNSHISREDRNLLHEHKSGVVWLTGLSASGKSTIAHNLEKKLYYMGYSTFVLDGDNVRHGLCSDLGFSLEDRSENIRRVGEMVNLFIQSGVITITAFISPLRKDRAFVRNLVGKENFIEIFVDCPIETCMARDPKGIYAKAANRRIKEFTGISSAYEPPENPDLVLNTKTEDLFFSVDKAMELVQERFR